MESNNVPADEFGKEVHRAVTDIVRRSEEALSVAETIAKHASRINESGYGMLLGHLQLAEVDQCVLNLSKLFDPPPRKYRTRSISALLETMERNADNLEIFDRSPLEELLREGGLSEAEIAAMADADLTRAFVVRYRRMLSGAASGMENVTDALERVRRRRDKQIAHNEAVELDENQRASWDDLHTVLSAAQRFASLVGPAYFDFHFASNDGTYMLSTDHQAMGRQMDRLLEKLGFTATE